MLTGLADSGESYRVPDWITAQKLRLWAVHPERMPSTARYAEILRAYLLIGGTIDDDVRQAVALSVDTRWHCPQLPDLYKASANDGCDFKASWEVWKLKILLDGRRPVSKAVGGSTGK
ncbi:hypothetical protein LK08_33370 [Streptomyces sp. MUSC 125]|nr:hypothetical protein LK08_33370 [Streptomyces sp. MUSC 125]